MTSRQNQHTMASVFEPGLPGTSRSDLPARTPHEITETYRSGIGRVVCAVDGSVCAGLNHRSGGPDDGRRVRIPPANEKRRPYGGGRIPNPPPGARLKKKLPRLAPGPGSPHRHLSARERATGANKLRCPG